MIKLRAVLGVTEPVEPLRCIGKPVVSHLQYCMQGYLICVPSQLSQATFSRLCPDLHKCIC